MDSTQFRKLHKIKDDVVVNQAALLDPGVKLALERQKYAIVKNVVESDVVYRLRDNWLKILERRAQFNSNLRYGESNYTANFFGKYKRHFQFYWNEPSCEESRSLSLLLHYYRNVIIDFDPMCGLTFQPDRTGIYLAVTHYPCGTGEMARHIDPNYFLPLHYALPLTFSGEDYGRGGLHLHVGDETVDIDNEMGAGDMLLFYGSVPHSVQRLSGAGSKTSLGRMQLFSIPTQFSTEKSRSFIGEFALQAYGRFKYLNYRLGKNLREDDKNFR